MRSYRDASNSPLSLTSERVQSKTQPKSSQAAKQSYESLKTKRAWDFAISPAKSLPMQAFMLYMSGGGVQIFSMGIVFMLLVTPFRNLAGMNVGAWRRRTVTCLCSD